MGVDLYDGQSGEVDGRVCHVMLFNIRTCVCMYTYMISTSEPRDIDVGKQDGAADGEECEDELRLQR